ncbi:MULTISPECIES: permease-like cell division protein FtsX [Agathobacter]|uniref:Cell division protein FtsX n=1 Tax=Agathobacter ruminis TaxID=1712665 RepID=A0A2G3DZF1_9FIRM|nr:MULTISPECIES: permease-like cell division protein FtsX [Agathobacter]MBQ1681946.1 permease-like cell division protein FtsX [Agathobacter sp.]MDC7300627.1 permease-like cell division protein FtsX [Agathobacter ruminis]PHU36265.1 ABC transporter permease [Agathobacter ruminis]
MRISTFWFTVKQGIKNIFRNKMFSLASVATMGACIFMFGLFFAVVTNFNSMLKEAEKGVAVAVYFNKDITNEQINTIGNDIKKRPEVSKVEYISADDAWEYVKENYFEGRKELIAAFEGDNPVANSMHYEIYLNDVEMQDALVTYIQNMDGVRNVKKSEQVANTLAEFNRLATYISGAIIFILLAVSIFLISNTVTVGISVRREEIGIMKLIGATDYLVRAPFIFEGMIIGLIGAAIPLVLIYFLYDWIIAFVASKFNFIGAMLNFIPTTQLFGQLIPISLIMGVGIGLVGSYFTVRKHLRV